jgi:hypothetical protein
MSQENVELARRFYEVGAATYARIDAIQEANESGDFGDVSGAAARRIMRQAVLERS